MSIARSLLAASIAAAAAASTPAQFPFTITDGNATFTMATFPDSPSSIRGASHFTANRPVASDTLNHHMWLYRVQGDGREYVFNSGAANRGFLVLVPAPDLAVIQWSDVDSRGLSAFWLLRVVSTGPNSGTLISKMTISNGGASPVTLDVFSYVDVDLCGASTNSAIGLNATNTRHQIRNPNRCLSERVEYLGANADRYEVDATIRLFAKLVDNLRDDLTNSGLPFGPNDYAGAMQWRRTLQPGGTETFMAILGHNQEICDQEATTVTYGTGNSGTNGVPVISTGRSPIIGTAAEISVIHALPNSPGVIVAGFGRANTTIGNVTLYTNPIADGPITFDGAGAGSLVLPVPNHVALCGGVIDFQCLFVDPAVQGTFPIAYTGGLEWTLGGY